MNRVRETEWIEDPNLPESERQRALNGLSRINRLTGLAEVLFHQLERYARDIPDRPLRVLDLASGNGELPISWAAKANRAGLNLCITASDKSENAIDQQQRLAQNANVTIQSVRLDCRKGDLPVGFDVVVCTLLMHQLDEPQAFRLLQSMAQSSNRSVMVCDIERTRWNLAVLKTASHLLSRSPVLRHDSVTTVNASFTREEFRRLAESALARPVKIRSVMPCRFLMTADEMVEPIASPAFA
ncbi:hypothetical protein CA13_56060 [Planctomycetes bacterium CA13]|uniref:Methyltransferase domain-containing protein n=1 Tax=Novipirellula herctigrandis TaxID=2527986 RepID=A0A5C5ZA96_9BACT|nr:hypothetical protein CA13_56060 [Planctomycetes bacterium CA13]